MKIFLGLPGSQAIPEPSLAHALHWALSAGLRPASHIDFTNEIQHHYSYTGRASYYIATAHSASLILPKYSLYLKYN